MTAKRHPALVLIVRLRTERGVTLQRDAPVEHKGYRLQLLDLPELIAAAVTLPDLQLGAGSCGKGRRIQAHSRRIGRLQDVESA